jgi:hypothetical protein
MSTSGNYHQEEEDIVTLNPEPGKFECAGWVNVGVHAVHIELNRAGDLSVTLHPRCAEGCSLHTMTQTRKESVAADGVDPDAE